jgi:hypothetical protein
VKLLADAEGMNVSNESKASEKMIRIDVLIFISGHLLKKDGAHWPHFS